MKWQNIIEIKAHEAFHTGFQYYHEYKVNTMVHIVKNLNVFASAHQSAKLFLNIYLSQ